MSFEMTLKTISVGSWLQTVVSSKQQFRSNWMRVRRTLGWQQVFGRTDHWLNEAGTNEDDSRDTICGWCNKSLHVIWTPVYGFDGFIEQFILDALVDWKPMQVF